jgi:putative restriction endonuclease
VFIQSSHSNYKDIPGKAYHFPKRSYLSRVEKTVGDWVIFFEGRRGGSRGYYAVQRVLRIEDDPADPSHAYAVLDQGSELSFEDDVSRWREDDTPYETGLPRSRGSNTSAVRLISDSDFAQIVEAGLAPRSEPDTLPRTDDRSVTGGFSDDAEPFVHAAVPREAILTQRAYRDRSFARQVKHAYAGRCCISGLELRNGEGRPEVEAAHILPVSEAGPDTVRNGLALSGTVHWMCDRGLISVGEEYEILIAKDSIADETSHRLITEDKHLLLPKRRELFPHQGYLRWHRDNVFKG